MMKLDKKIVTIFMIFSIACVGIMSITSAAVSIASYNHDLFFDERFSFLNRYAVNDFIPVAAGAVAMIGCLCSLWAMKFVNLKTAPNMWVFLRQLAIGALPYILALIVLFLFGQYVRSIYLYGDYRGLASFAQSLFLFHQGGFFLGMSFYHYGRIQQEQKPVS